MVTRKHLAGLKLARECVGYSNSETSAWDKCDELDELIAQASAATEQEAVAWVPCSPEWLAAGGNCATAPRIGCEPGCGISHMHPALARPIPEIEQLRDGLGECKGNTIEARCPMCHQPAGVAVPDENDCVVGGYAFLAIRGKDELHVTVDPTERLANARADHWREKGFVCGVKPIRIPVHMLAAARTL